MLLVFNRTGTHRNIGKQVGKITVIVRVQHFVRTGKAVITQSRHMKLSYGYNTLKHIGDFIRVGLVKHTLVAVTCGSRLIGVYAGNDKYFILHLILNGAKAGYVIEYRLAAVCRTGTDYKYKLIRLTSENPF